MTADRAACLPRDAGFEAQLAELLAFESGAGPKASRATVAAILATCGRAATRRCSNTRAASIARTPARVAALEIPRQRLERALRRLAARTARGARTGRRAHPQLPRAPALASWQYTEADGTMLGQQVTPLDRVGIYVPGGKAAYPSSVLMNAMPAKVAGVRRNHHGRADAAAANATTSCWRRRHRGVDRVFTIGGAQAVAALAYGTQTIAAGGQDRRARQRLCRRRQAPRVRRGRHRHGGGPVGDSGDRDGATDPDWIAMDLFSQAEHDEIAQAILLCPDAGIHRTSRGQHRTPA